MKDLLKTLRRSGVILGLVLTAAGCNNNPTSSADMVPDFRLKDVNPNSATSNQTVSPRNYVGRFSAWYFGEAG